MKKGLFCSIVPAVMLIIAINTLVLKKIEGQVMYQSSFDINFYGLSPSIIKPAGLVEDGFDFNICPLVFYRIVGDRTGLRITHFINLGNRPERLSGNTILSSLGGEMSVPIFFDKRISDDDVLEGFYLGPTFRGFFVIEESRNRSQFEIGFYAEPGYSMVFYDNYAFKVGLLLGRTLLLNEIGNNFSNSEWKNHIGIKFVFGSWI